MSVVLGTIWCDMLLFINFDVAMTTIFWQAVFSNFVLACLTKKNYPYFSNLDIFLVNQVFFYCFSLLFGQF